MGILNRLASLKSQRSKRAQRKTSSAQAQRQSTNRRHFQFEAMEPRQMLAADLLLGSVYFEEATGDDTSADVIHVSFEGGAAQTSLDHLTISGDKVGDGLTSGDLFFDTSEGGLGSFGAVGLNILSHDGFDITGFHVVDGGTQITFDFSGFDAGEVLEFSIDVDEAQFVSAGGEIDTNALVEGAEFQRSIITGQFTAPGF